jgi:hypothetical protein
MDGYPPRRNEEHNAAFGRNQTAGLLQNRFQASICHISYDGFDWSSIGAGVLKEDEDGVSSVEWNGQVFTRRSPNNRFDAAIWFSRCVGKDSDGNNRYVRLISFKVASDAEPIAAKAKKAARS